MAKAKEVSSVNVTKDGVLIRTYSEAEHGEDFEKLAEEFASKEQGQTVEKA